MRIKSLAIIKKQFQCVKSIGFLTGFKVKLICKESIIEKRKPAKEFEIPCRLCDSKVLEGYATNPLRGLPSAMGSGRPMLSRIWVAGSTPNPLKTVANKSPMEQALSLMSIPSSLVAP